MTEYDPLSPPKPVIGRPLEKGNVKIGRPFKKGEIHNPRGRPKIPQELRLARKLRRDTFEIIGHKNILLPVKQLEAKRKDKALPAIEILVISVILHAIKWGDQARLNFLLDRLIGRIEDNPVRVEMPKGELPTYGDLLSTAIRIGYAELERMKKKAANDGLSSDDHKTIGVLTRNMIEVKTAHHEISVKKDEYLATIPTDELIQEAQRLIEDVKAKQILQKEVVPPASTAMVPEAPKDGV